MFSIEYLAYGIKRIVRKPPSEIIHFGLYTAKLIPVHVCNKKLLKQKGTLEISDEAFIQRLNHINFEKSASHHDTLYEYFLNRKDNFFFEANEELRSMYLLNFSEESKETIEMADRFLNHDFEFLGKQLKFDDKINYHFDFDQNSESNTYFVDINYLATEKDIKITWELNRHQYLTILAKAYFITGDERYAQEVCTQIDEWIQQNPYLLGVNWIEGIEASIRMYSWIFAYQFIKSSQSLTSELNFKILKFIYLHGAFIRNFLSDKWLINGNHILAELSGLILIGTVFPEFKECEEWVKFASDKLGSELEKQVFDDGAIWEHSTGYQKFVTEMVLYPVILMTKIEIKLPEIIINKLQKMIDFLVNISMSNGIIPLIGDDDQGFMLKLDGSEYGDIKDISTCRNVLFNTDTPTFKSELAFWLFNGLVTNQNKVSFQNEGFRLFKSSGYCAFRSSQDYLLFVTTAQDTKYLHAAHRHLDMLSFVYEYNGEYFIVDNGTYIYNGDEYNRNSFRSIWMHNTLTVDDTNPCDLGPFELQPKPYAKIQKSGVIDGCPFIWAIQDGYESAHNRVITQVKDGYLIYDFISKPLNTKYEIYMHLHPEVIIDKIDDNHLKLTMNNIHINLFSIANIDIFESRFSPKYGVVRNSKSLKININDKCKQNMLIISRNSIISEVTSLEIINRIVESI
jgi:hypothetical protein